MNLLNDYTSSDDEDNEQNLALNPHDLDLLESLNPYSQNFAANQLEMATVFIHMPWSPKLSTIRQLNGCTRTILRHLELHHNDFYSRYDWINVGDEQNYRAAVPAAVHGHHITMTLNRPISPHHTEKFQKSFESAIRSLAVPSQLVRQASDPLGSKLQSLNPSKIAASHKHIQFRFKPHLQLLTSVSTPALFVAAMLDMDPYTKQFLDRVSAAISDIFLLVDQPSEPHRVHQFHVSLARSSDQVLHPQLTPNEVAEKVATINAELSQMSVPELASIPVEIDTIEVVFQHLTRTTVPLKFNI